VRREGFEHNRRICRLGLRVDLVGCRRMWPAHVGGSSVQTDPDGSRRIAWMINRMINQGG
jgi:hypothetical protein